MSAADSCKLKIVGYYLDFYVNFFVPFFNYFCNFFKILDTSQLIYYIVSSIFTKLINKNQMQYDLFYQYYNIGNDNSFLLKYNTGKSEIVFKFDNKYNFCVSLSILKYKTRRRNRRNIALLSTYYVHMLTITIYTMVNFYSI